MSTDLPRYSERLVEAFLDEGPIRMSDRLFDAIVDDIYATRQQGRRALWRYRSMNRTALAAAVIVVVVAVAGLAVATIRAPGTDVGNQPSPMPSATPAPSPTPAPAIGATLPGSGSVMAVNEFTEPFTFVMPVFPKDGSTAVRGEALDAVGWRRNEGLRTPVGAMGRRHVP